MSLSRSVIDGSSKVVELIAIRDRDENSLCHATVHSLPDDGPVNTETCSS